MYLSFSRGWMWTETGAVHAFFFDTRTQRVVDPTIPDETSAVAYQNGYYIALQMDYGEYLDAFMKNSNPGAWQNPAFAIPCKKLAQWSIGQGLTFGG